MIKNEYYPFAPVSRTFTDILYNIDGKFYDFEQTVLELEKQLKEYKDLYYAEVSKRTLDMNSMMASTLLACIGEVPNPKDITPAFATAIARIGDMTSIDEVHDYVNKYKKQIEQII